MVYRFQDPFPFPVNQGICFNQLWGLQLICSLSFLAWFNMTGVPKFINYSSLLTGGFLMLICLTNLAVGEGRVKINALLVFSCICFLFTDNNVISHHISGFTGMSQRTIDSTTLFYFIWNLLLHCSVCEWFRCLIIYTPLLASN